MRRRYYLVADTPESRPCSKYLRDRYREAPALYLWHDPQKPYVSSNCEMPPIEPGLMAGIGESDAARRTKQYRSHLIDLKLFRQMREENKSRPGAPQAAKGGHPSPAPPLPMRPDRQTEAAPGNGPAFPGAFYRVTAAACAKAGYPRRRRGAPGIPPPAGRRSGRCSGGAPRPWTGWRRSPSACRTSGGR